MPKSHVPTCERPSNQSTDWINVTNDGPQGLGITTLEAPEIGVIELEHAPITQTDGRRFVAAAVMLTALAALTPAWPIAGMNPDSIRPVEE